LAQGGNTSFARGNNLAINAAAAGSEWIALLNPDAFPEPRWLIDCLLSAQRNPPFDIFGSKLVNASAPLLLDGAGDAYHVSDKLLFGGSGPDLLELVTYLSGAAAPITLAMRSG